MNSKKVKKSAEQVPRRNDSHWFTRLIKSLTPKDTEVRETVWNVQKERKKLLKFIGRKQQQILSTQC